jgi:methanethiol S-methyltransferase
MKQFQAKIIANLGLSFGAGSLFLFMIFLYVGSFCFLEFGLNNTRLLIVDASLCLAFFIQHSAMLRKGFRRYLSQLIPPFYYSAAYAIASGIVLLIVLLFWQKSPFMVFSASGAFWWIFRFIFLFSIAGFFWASRSLGGFDPFGAKTIFYHISDKQPKTFPLTIRGPYKYIRHPFYFFSILMIWSCPYISADRLMFNLLWTGWIIIGTYLEERDLVGEFGEEYQSYQATVPVLIPYKIFGKHP